jgi:hypothetical protein
MSLELQTYKQNRINELIKTYNYNVSLLNSALALNIKNVQLSNNRNKTALINALINKNNIDIATLKNNLNIAIQKVNAFNPVFNINQSLIKNKKALLIGINYLNTQYQLSGCINDTNNMKELLSSYGFNDFKILTDNTSIKPTKTNILNELKNFIVNSKSGDILFFQFSGHGTWTYDKNNDETDGRDEMIVSSDLQYIWDDELKNILQNNMKDGVTLIGLFDSCHSGTILDLKYNYLDSSNYNNYSENIKVSEVSGNVIMISGCMDTQTSADSFINNISQGALTWSFIDCIKKKPNSSWRELLKTMRDLLKTKGYSQIPQLSTDSFYNIDSKLFI